MVNAWLSYRRAHYCSWLCITHLSHTVPSGPPLNFTVSVDITSLTCSWDQPEEDLRNGVITSYTLTCLTVGEAAINVTLKPTVQQITMDLFTYSTTYNCTVSASTAVGAGPSAPSISVTTEGTIILASVLVLY